MKNLYRFLAMLMFLCFVALSGAYFLNNTINKVVKTADVKFDKFIAEYNKQLGDAAVSHNLYFVNCFPNVCAKVSFGRYENKQDEQINRYDVGFTDFVIAKYSPLTDEITLDLNANNVILLKNNKNIGSAYFKKLNYTASASFAENYLSSLVGDTKAYEKSLESSSELTIENPRLSLEEKRIKADFLNLKTETFDITENTVSSLLDIAVDGFAIDNSVEKANMDYSIEIINLSKEIVLAFSEIESLKVDLTSKKLNPEVTNKLIKIARVIIEGVKEFNVNKTQIKFIDSGLELYNSKENKVLANYGINIDLTLDENLDPEGVVQLDFSEIANEAKSEIENIEFKDKKTGKTYKLFKRVDSGEYVSNVEFKDGKAIVNSKEIEIKGQFKALLDFASGMLGLMAMQTQRM